MRNLIPFLALVTIGCGPKQKSIDAAVAAAMAQKQAVAPVAAQAPIVADPTPTATDWVYGVGAGCHVGSAPMLSNIGMTRSTAEMDGRVGVQKSLAVFMKALLDDSGAALIAQGKTVEEREIRKVNIEKLGTGAEMVENVGTRADLFEPRDGTMYARVCIDGEALIAKMNEQAALSEATKEAVRTRMKGLREEAYGPH